MNKRYKLLAAIMLSVSLVSEASAETIRMAFTGSPTTLSLPFFVAQKKGWLGDLKVEEIYVTGDANALRVLVSRNVDIATVGVMDVLSSIEEGAKVRAIGSWQPSPDYYLVFKKGNGQTVSDLAGKTIAASGPGGMPDQIPRLLMRIHHVDESSARFLQVGGHSARLQAVLSGRVGATVINSITVAIGDGNIEVADRIANEFPKLGYVWNVVREDSLNDPKLTKAFQTLTTAGIRGSRFIMENPGEAASILHERIPSLPMEVCLEAVKAINRDKLWGDHGGLDMDSVAYTVSLARRLEILHKDLTPSDIVDERFVEASEKQLTH